MTRPLTLNAPGIYVPADVCAWIAPTLQRALAAERIIGAQVHPDVAETVERLALLGEAYRNRRNDDERSDPSRLDTGSFVEVQWVTAPEAAALLNKRPQSVTGLCRRGTLHAEQQHDRSWRVCSASVTARLENTKCQH